MAEDRPPPRTKTLLIHSLPEHVIRLIAAGEVIERPASVVKELVENSLDAGATHIQVDIEAAGRDLIRVADDGSGMSPEDAALSLERHATSKLNQFDDLERLTTFGFRGEALPSIAAVSRMTLITMPAKAAHAWKITEEGGSKREEGPAARAPGTTIELRNLFFNTPARAKFLKSETTEKSRILRTLEEIALAHPAVGFTFVMDGRKSVDLPSGMDPDQRLQELLGKDLAKSFVPVHAEHPGIQVSGWLSKVPAHRSTRSDQYLFVNRRPVQHKLVQHAIYEAYHEWLPVGRHPAFVLFLNVDPKEIDVNVHPSKREVRFAQDRPIHDFVMKAIRQALTKEGGVPSRTGDGLRVMETSRDTYLPSSRVSAVPSSDRGISPQGLDLRDPSTLPLRDQSQDDRFINSQSPIRVLTQFKRLYLVCEDGEDMLLIDQHAAAERLLYERFSKNYAERKPQSQALLVPFHWELSPARSSIVERAREQLEGLGFSLRSLGGTSWAVDALPVLLTTLRNADAFLNQTLDSLEEELAGSPEIIHDKIARAACRAAIKASDPLTPIEMQVLLKDLRNCERPMTCPHGRPTQVRIPKSQLDKWFGRT